MNEPDFHLRISSKKTYFIFDVRRDNTDQGYTPCNIIVFIQSLFVCHRNIYLGIMALHLPTNDIISASLFDFGRIRLHA